MARTKNEAESTLKGFLKPGDTVYCILRHVSSSGMTRQIGLVVFKDGHDYHPNHAAALLLGRRVNKAGNGIVCQGCGMDMGFDLVYSLSLALFGDGYQLKHRWL